MSEKAPEATEGKKKKSKLPMIVALVAVLGGGGYFMMKPKPPKSTVKVIEMGATVDIKEEFLVNLSNSDAYLRTEISLQMTKDFKGHVEEEMSVIRDSILTVLSQATIEDMKSVEKVKKLRHDIADSLNKVLAEEDHAKDAKAEEPKKGQAVIKEKKEIVDVPEDWDSKEGPVLKVLFRSRAWQ